MAHRFVKMNGLGNDFVVVAADDAPFEPGEAQVRAIADRTTGTGCDQLIVIGRSDVAHAHMRIWNCDGGEVATCGNAARCVGWLMMQSVGVERVRVETAAGILEAEAVGDMRVRVDMGAPRLDWRDIPLAQAMDTRDLAIDLGHGLRRPGAVSMGNPHVVFFVDDAETAPVREVGPAMELHHLFPRRANVGFAQIVGRDRIRLRVWERGAGLTRACGSGACAALVAAHRRGLADRAATVELDGGELEIAWSEADDRVRMTGPVAIEFAGYLPCLS